MYINTRLKCVAAKAAAVPTPLLRKVKRYS